MNVSQFFLILWVRRKIIALTLLFTSILAVLVVFYLPKNYVSSATLILNYKGVDPVSGLTLPGQLMPGYIATQIDIIRSRNVALKVVDELKLADIPTVRDGFYKDSKGVGSIRDWLVELLLQKLDILPSKDSSVINLTIKDADPQFAATLANAFASAYQEVVLQLKVEPAKQASAYFSTQVKELRSNLERAQQKLSKYQQEKGIVSADNRLDVEMARLNDLSSQLVSAQAQAIEASSRRTQAQSGRGFESPDVMANPLVQSLKSELSRAESKFSDISQKLDRNHPEYQGAQAEIEKLKANLNEQIRLASSGVANNARILQARESEIRASLAAQKAKVLELNRSRDDVGLMLKEVDNAQRAYDAAVQRFNQISVESSSTQIDIALLNPATPAVKPSGPSPVLIAVIAMIVGAFLGFLFAIIAELLDRRIRASSDLQLILDDVPTLGVIEWQVRTDRMRASKSFFRLMRSN